jgi:hypothetical protein
MELQRIDARDFANIQDDPVRPELDMDFRLADGREVYGLYEGTALLAVICAAYVSQIPHTVSELGQWSLPLGTSVVFYTVWSYCRGAGRDIVLAAREHILQEHPELEHMVTMSPKTQMARDFHLRNGAKLLSENEETNTFEYQRT